MFVSPPDIVKETTRLALALRYEHSIVCGPAVTAEAVPSVHCVFDPFHPASADLVLEGVTDTMLRAAARPALRVVR